MKLCDYGCGQEAEYEFKNGKWCCSKNWKQCPESRKKYGESMKGRIPHNKGKILPEEQKKKIGESLKRRVPWNKNKTDIYTKETLKLMSRAKMGKIPYNKGKKTGPLSIEHKKKIRESKKGKNTGPLSEEHKKNISNSKKFALKDYKEKHLFFCSIEELKENEKGEIQGHCKNHNCKNSKEKDGWFTLTKSQIQERITALEIPRGFGESHFYCSQHCKDTCILFGLQGDPLKNNNKPYTSEEKEVFNELILKRDNEICYYCKEHTATIVHHLRPQKLEPFFVLDPDYAVSVCAKCHYKHGHPTGSKYSTGNLAKIVCSVESQKFLNQKY